MIECSIDNINDINFFLKLMDQKKITKEMFKMSPTKYVLIRNIGFIAYSIYYDRAEIDYIYVLSDYRKKGYASKLLKYILDKVNALENITLEVNVNNVAAINLYEKFDFKIATQRKNYYGNENAYLMIRKMI